MNLPKTSKINSKGHLEIGGCDTAALAKKFGTPLFVLDEDSLRSNCREYIQAFRDYPDFRIIYANKALSVIGVLKIIKTEGIGMDVASGGELYTALRAGCKAGTIYFHGNNKTGEEIEYGVREKVTFVADNLDELGSVEKASRKADKKTGILLRVNPGIEAHTHDFIKTGAVDSKFGISKKEVLKTVGKIIRSKNLVYKGLHSHIGSMIFDKAPYAAEIEVLLGLFRDIKRKYRIESDELNIGGGIGVAYTSDTRSPELKPFADKIIRTVTDLSKRFKLKLPRLVLEPGRSLVGPAMVTLYTVGTVKDIAGIRKYAVIDGGMSDNPRFILYGSKYEAFVASNARARAEEKLTIAGRACESGDIIIKDCFFPKVKKGDIIAVACTGAYNYSMASNYNKFMKPAMVNVRSGKANLLLKRETYADLVRNEL